jgi:hypothetical protein
MKEQFNEKVEILKKESNRNLENKNPNLSEKFHQETRSGKR